MPPRKSLSSFTTNAKPKAPKAEPLPKGVRRKTEAEVAKAKAAKAKPSAGIRQELAPDTGEAEKVMSTTIRLPVSAWEQAKIMAFAARVPVNRIYTMALDDYFEKHGKPRNATK